MSTVISEIIAGSLMLSSVFPREGDTAFSRLSKAAQDAIVGAVVGDETPELTDDVKAEIAAWASTTD